MSPNETHAHQPALSNQYRFNLMNACGGGGGYLQTLINARSPTARLPPQVGREKALKHFNCMENNYCMIVREPTGSPK